MSWVWLLALGTGCPDYQLRSNTDESDIWPVIRVEPNELWFDDTAPLDTSWSSVLLANDGDVLLEIDAIKLTTTEEFAIEDMLSEAGTLILSPGEDLQLEASFTPLQAAELSATLLVKSDDPVSPQVLVPFFGQGIQPRLEVTPDPLDIMDVYQTCTRQDEVLLTSAGGVTLTIEELLYTGSGVDFDPWPELPLDLTAGQSLALPYRYAPQGDESHEGELWVASTDPNSPRVVQVWATGVRTQGFLETFEYDGFENYVDILFYVDQSGSMDDDRAAISANFSVFVDTLNLFDSDFQVMVATDDSGCHNGQIITQATPDPNDAIQQAVDGSAGLWTESGLTVVTRALSDENLSGCNAGFLRGYSTLAIVLVSDEPEQSMESWDHYVDLLLDIDPEVVINAVAGPVPDGCETATPGTGYQEAVTATGGVFISICSDWGATLEELAFGATVASRSFSLEPSVDQIS